MTGDGLLSCPQCGQRLVLRRGRWHCPRCDYWKESYGERDWQNHASNVNTLLDELGQRFPQVTWTTGLGATSGHRLDIPPKEKGEPDITGWWMRKPFVSIEVSGTISPSVRIPPDPILIRPGKLTEAEQMGRPYFFYMVYNDSQWVVTPAVAAEGRRKIVAIKRSGRTETYIAISPAGALPGSALFTLVAELLHKLDPRITQGQLL